MEINSYLSFKLGKEMFGLNVNKVISIVEMQKITRLPRAPEFIMGVTNLRGSILPVINTHYKFGLEPFQQTYNTCILVINITFDNEDYDIGLIVDFVNEVFENSDDEIIPPPSLGAKYQSEFIYGVIKKDDEFIMLVNIDKFFTVEDTAIFNTEKEPQPKTKTQKRAKKNKTK